MTKFYRQGASGTEELVLVPAEGMSTNEQVEAALAAFYAGLPLAYFPTSAREDMRAALAAAQAGGDEQSPAVQKAMQVFEDGLAARRHAEGFAAGIEAAAKMLENTDRRFLPLREWEWTCSLIRALRPPAAPAGVLCTYGPPQERTRRWILKFDDPDRGEMHFDDEGEAMTMFQKCQTNWTCTLFVTAERQANDGAWRKPASAPAGAPSETVAVPRHWLKSVLVSIQGELPRGHIGDVAFLMREQIEDLLRQ